MGDTTWLTIEVSDGDIAAIEWSRIYALDIAQALSSSRASSWLRHQRSWGVVLEISFQPDVAPAELSDCPELETVLREAPNPRDGVRWYFGRGEGGVPAEPTA